MNVSFASGLILRWSDRSKCQLLEWPISHRLLISTLQLE